MCGGVIISQEVEGVVVVSEEAASPKDDQLCSSFIILQPHQIDLTDDIHQTGQCGGANELTSLTYLQPHQIDLTDDYVVVSIFGDGTWERTIQKVTVKDDGGSMTDARLDQEAFRDLISIML